MDITVSEQSICVYQKTLNKVAGLVEGTNSVKSQQGINAQNVQGSIAVKNWMPIESWQRNQYTPVRMAKFHSTDSIAYSANEAVEQQELSYIYGGNAKWYSHFQRQFGDSLKN